MDGTVSMVMINFLAIMIMFGIIIYIIGEVTKVRKDIDEQKDYNSSNERQLANLINDINDNDKVLHKYIDDLRSKLL
jgi:predicted PurR-regulated permease PerM